MIGVGLDAVDIERFRAVLVRRPNFVTRVFSSREQSDLSRRSDPVPGFAARFAAKEATMKALGVGIGRFRFVDVELVRDSLGAPSIQASGAAALVAQERGVSSFHVSLTHTDTTASAIVLAE